MRNIFIWLLTLAFVLLAPNLLAQPTGGADGGRVLEAVPAGTYVYLRVQADENGEIWLATRSMPVEAGDEVRWTNGAVMKDFDSPTMERRFDWIVFANGVAVVTDGPAAAHGYAAHASDQTKTAHSTGDVAPLAGGLTVGEIFARRGDLTGERVALRVQVIKVSENILGKNWITLQDGTGEAPGDRLIATSAETAEVGEVLVARGTVAVDVDLGSGYRYPVLLEQASFER